MTDTDRAAAPGSGPWSTTEAGRLLDVAAGASDPRGGFGWLDDHGRRDPDQPRATWITARMTHVFALAALAGRAGATELVDHGVTALRGPLRDAEHDGWFSTAPDDADPGAAKEAYPHMFVVLAAASASVAGRPGAPELLADALAVVRERFWDDGAGLCVESWSRDWSVLDDYRGANANMHAVEAFLTAADATGDAWWRAAALRIAERLIDGSARAGGWRIPEHFDAHWHPLLDYNRERPADPFRPYGATVGHALEWSRLLLHLEAGLAAAAPGWLRPAAVALYDRAVADGCAVDGADGFVYTTDWDGAPVVHERMHWVLAEGLGAAAALRAATGEPRYGDDLARWWAYADRYLVDPADGSWRHELDRGNAPAATVWHGRPDAYHALQATLIPRLPLAPTLALAVREHRGPALIAPPA